MALTVFRRMTKGRFLKEYCHAVVASHKKVKTCLLLGEDGNELKLEKIAIFF